MLPYYKIEKTDEGKNFFYSNLGYFNFWDEYLIANTDTNNDEIVATKDYLIHLILCCIPIVNIIILLIRIFSKKTNKNLKNLSKAQLILIIIVTVLSIVLSIAFGALIASAISGNSTQTNDYNYSSNYDYEYDYDFNY